MDKREKAPLYTDEEWEKLLHGDKPDYFTDEQWADFLADHPDIDQDKVVRLDKSKRQKKQPPPPPPGGWPSWLSLLRRDERGRVFPDLANVLIALRHEQRLLMA